MTFNDLLKERAEMKVMGTIVNITGEKEKVSKSGWTGAMTEVTLDVNGMKQKITVMGRIGKDEFDINVFQLDGEGKILKDDEGKNVMKKISPDKFNDKVYAYFGKKEVIEWGERDADGKAHKIEHISELTGGRFAQALIENKESLIGKRVGITGNVQFRPNQKFDKIEASIEINQITIQKTEEGKSYNDYFLIQAPVILNKEALGNMDKDEAFTGYVPVYNKILKKNVHVPFNFTISDNGFLMISKELGFTLEDRKDMFLSKIEAKTQGANFVIMTALLNYKSGMIEREITIEELCQDPVYGRFAQRAMNSPEDLREEAIKNFKEMYKKQNPATVKGEFKQKIDFLTINQTREDGDKVCGIDPQMFTIYTLDKLKQDLEKKEQPKKEFSMPKVNTVKPEEISKPNIAPPTDINEINFDEEFPFN